MRITGIRTRQVDVDLPAPFYLTWAPGTKETRIRVCYVRHRYGLEAVETTVDKAIAPDSMKVVIDPWV